jgi:hypothetical protein
MKLIAYATKLSVDVGTILSKLVEAKSETDYALIEAEIETLETHAQRLRALVIEKKLCG